MSRFLLTGCAGLLGSWLSERLVADGHTVVGVDDFSSGRKENIAHLVDQERFTFVRHDVTTGLNHIDGPFDYVAHLASPASPPDYLARPVETMRAGSYGSHAALDVALRDKAVYLVASTSEIYGDPLIHPQPESYWGNVSSVGPRSCYDEAKRYAEAITMAYHRAHGLEVRIARIFNTYGPRMRPDDGRSVSNFIVQALKGEPITLFGDGSQTRSFCYVTDLVDGLLRLMRSDVTEPVNLGRPREFTIRELAEQVIKLTGSTSELKLMPLPEDDPKVRQPVIDRARDLLGWEPNIPLEEGLVPTIEYFKTQVG